MFNNLVPDGPTQHASGLQRCFSACTDASRIPVSAAVAVMALVAGPATSQILYNANGFEPSSFVEGNLVGQDGWITQGVGNSTAEVHGLSSGDPIQSGTQALTLFRDGDDAGLSTYFNVPLSPFSFQSRFVTVSWDMFVPTNPSIVEYGPGFTIEAYATGNKRIAALGMDAADGSLYQVINNDPSSPTFTLTPDVSLEEWQNWKMILDLARELVYLSVDGQVIVNASPLLEDISFGAGDKLTDASLTVHATDGNFLGVDGVAYIDNYYIQTSAFQNNPGDFNGNGTVEQGDLDLVLANWGAAGFPTPGGWINDLPSGNIDQNELDAVLGNWGVSVTPSLSGFAVPEPGLAGLAFAAGAMVLRRRGLSR